MRHKRGDGGKDSLKIIAKHKEDKIFEDKSGINDFTQGGPDQIDNDKIE